MLETSRSYGGMVSAPHHLAAQAGVDVLRDGGNAIEAMIAAAAAIAVAYPHMNGMGGDCFFMIAGPDSDPLVIEASGRAAELASRSWYRDQGQDIIPSRGPQAALTVAGAVSGWQTALELSRRRFSGKLPLSRLLEPAAMLAREGVAVASSLHSNTVNKLADLESVSGFREAYLDAKGTPLAIGARLRQPRIADVLEQLAHGGLEDFYRGEVARSVASDLERLGSPLRLADLQAHHAVLSLPLRTEVRGHTLYNAGPPTQGLASLMILAIYSRLAIQEAESFAFLHGLVEATKAAFTVRDRYVTDPDFMEERAETFLAGEYLDDLTARIDMKTASPWPCPALAGDTVWLGASDSAGNCVSFIQSLYWEFGSGIVLPQTGITWQNRGTSFALDEGALNRLESRRRPFHTIQPPLAHLSDGRLMAYGTMGGEGQPQTQAAVFLRHVVHGQDLQAAVTAPRWLLGRTWGQGTTNLKLENRFGADLVTELRSAGHDIEIVPPFDDLMGHAGAVVVHSDGLIEGAADPRSDGCAAAI
jgi:oxamate amidohydrolase